MIEMAVIIALTVFFLHECTREGMIFGFVYYWLYDLPSGIKKPLFDCPTCMSVWYGIVIIFICRWTGYTPVASFWQYVICLFMAGGINAVLLGLINKQEKRKCNCSESKFNLNDK
jgi:hypothetical protein